MDPVFFFYEDAPHSGHPPNTSVELPALFLDTWKLQQNMTDKMEMMHQKQQKQQEVLPGSLTVGP